VETGEIAPRPDVQVDAPVTVAPSGPPARAATATAAFAASGASVWASPRPDWSPDGSLGQTERRSSERTAARLPRV
jgi:hypothetical protein